MSRIVHLARLEIILTSFVLFRKSSDPRYPTKLTTTANLALMQTDQLLFMRESTSSLCRQLVVFFFFQLLLSVL